VAVEWSVEGEAIGACFGGRPVVLIYRRGGLAVPNQMASLTRISPLCCSRSKFFFSFAVYNVFCAMEATLFPT
jgi:hypothetical protein